MASDTDTDSTFRNLAKGGSIVFGGMVLELGISFVAKAVIARELGPVDYGAVSLGITVAMLTTMAVVLGLDTGIGRFLPQYEDPGYRRGILIAALQISLPLAFLAGGTIATFAPFIARYVFNDPSTSPVLRIFGVVIPFVAIMRLSLGSIQGQERSLPKVFIENLTLPITRFGAILIVIVLGFGSIGVAWAYLASYVVGALFGVYYLVHDTSLLSRVAPVRMHRELLSFSAPLLVSGAMMVLLSDMDTFMLGYFSGTGDVGIYNVVYPVSQLLTVALSSVTFVFMPAISRLYNEGDDESVERIYQVVTKWIFLATLPMFLVIVLFPTMTITIAFTEQYSAGAPALSILAAAFFTHAIVGPNSNVLISIGYTRRLMYANVVTAVINLLLNLLLIPEYSYLGAAVATAISYALLNALYSYQLYSLTGIHPFSRGLVRPGVIAVGLVGVIYWVTRTFFTVTILVLIVMFAVFVGLYGVAILRFGGIEEEEVMLVLSIEERFGLDLGPVKRLVNWLMSEAN